MPSISFLSQIALELGSENTYVLLDAKSPVYRCASCVLLDAHKEGTVYAAGDEARHMDGRTGEDTLLFSPIQYGGVADSELVAMLLLSAIEKASGRRRGLDKSRLVFAIPDGATRVERAALAQAAQLAGAKRTLLVKAPLAAAIELKKHVERAEAQLMVSIGAQVTEVCVMSGCGIALSRHMKTGSAAFDAAIVEYIRKKHELVISSLLADEIKRDLGTAVAPATEITQTLSGRSVRTGKPVTVQLSSQEIYEALSAPVEALIGAICDALYHVPADCSGDILKNGICLTGGGSELFGLAERLGEDTQLEIHHSIHPSFDAVKGAYQIAHDDKMVRALTNAYSAYEI